MQNNCIPPTKNMMHVLDGQPATGSPYKRVRIIMNNTKINDIKQNNKPITEAIA